MNGGDVIFNFKGNTSDIEKEASGLSNKVKSATGTALKAMSGLAVGSATAIVGVTTKAVQAQGELEQQIGGTEAVFKQYAKTVQNDGAAAFDKMGVSANEYMAYMNKMGSLMQGSGIDTKKAMDLSSQAMQRAADVASVMGISVDDAMTAIAGAAKGNFTMMDNLGVAMNATSLEAYAMEKGLKKSYKTMEQGEKIELAMQMFLEKSAHAAGNYAKENKTFAGSLNTVKAAVQNLLAGTGTIDQVMTAIQNFGTILATNLQTIVPQVVTGLVGLINGIIPLLPTLIQAVLPSLIQGIVDLTIGIIEQLPTIVQMIADMLPDLIPIIVDAIMQLIPALIAAAPQFIAAGIYLILRFAEGIWNAWVQLLYKVGTWIVQLVNKVKSAVTNFVNIGKQFVQGLWNGITNSLTWIKNKIKQWVGNVMSFIRKLFGISSPSKEFEIIGKYNVMGLEEGIEKERVNLQDTFDSMFDLSPNLYGSSSLNLSPTVNVVNNITMKQDSLGQMVNEIKTFSGGAKNDYSYGMGV